MRGRESHGKEKGKDGIYSGVRWPKKEGLGERMGGVFGNSCLWIRE